MDAAAALRKFRSGIPGVVQTSPGAGNLPMAAIMTAQSAALVYLHGAHITHFQVRGHQPLLFTSAKSLYAPGKAIRGGVPIVFPWFGPNKTDPQAPNHGFARTMPWTLSNTTEHKDGSVTVSLTLKDDASTRKLWPHAFELEYRITIADFLKLDLKVRNPGPDPFTFEEALHSYFAVEDVRRITLAGLADRDFLDKTQDMTRFRQADAELKIAAEIDSHYLPTRDTVTIGDPAANRQIRIEKQNSEVTVVWNPWIEKSKSLPDLADDDWQKFVCVETANAYDYAVKLAPGGEHTMTAQISS
jgi:glucose-6-phosphate 1-epimerase